MTNESNPAPVVVVGATGQQGSATVDALREKRVPVRALTRHPDGASAAALTARGVEVVGADLDDATSMTEAFRGASAVFAMTTYDGPRGTEGEVEQGQVLARAVQAARVPFVLYSSVGGSDRHTGVPHFESKRRIEEFFLDTSVPTNFVRPSFFMDNLTRLIRRNGDDVMVAMPLPDGVALQMISVRDIGRTAAAVIVAADLTAEPVEIAGDEVTGSQLAEIVARRVGRRTTYVAAPLEVLGDDEDRKAMFRWFTDLPAYKADFARTRTLVPDVESLDSWLARQDALLRILSQKPSTAK